MVNLGVIQLLSITLNQLVEKEFRQTENPMSAVAAAAQGHGAFTAQVNQGRVPVREIYGVPVDWYPKSSYCGQLPPEHLSPAAVVNWLRQKTQRAPVDPRCTDQENRLRQQECTSMQLLRMQLILKERERR